MEIVPMLIPVHVGMMVSGLDLFATSQFVTQNVKIMENVLDQEIVVVMLDGMDPSALNLFVFLIVIMEFATDLDIVIVNLAGLETFVKSLSVLDVSMVIVTHLEIVSVGTILNGVENIVMTLFAKKETVSMESVSDPTNVVVKKDGKETNAINHCVNLTVSMELVKHQVFVYV